MSDRSRRDRLRAEYAATVAGYAEPASDYERVAAYQAAMKRWHAQQRQAAKASAAYYAGGFKVSIHGMPVRLTINPTKHMLALMRDSEGFSTVKENASIRHPETTYTPSPA